MKLLTN